MDQATSLGADADNPRKSLVGHVASFLMTGLTLFVFRAFIFLAWRTGLLAFSAVSEGCHVVTKENMNCILINVHAGRRKSKQGSGYPVWVSPNCWPFLSFAILAWNFWQPEGGLS